MALLDVDICGPSIPRMMGLEGEQVGCDKILSIFLEIVTFYKKNYWVLPHSKNQS